MRTFISTAIFFLFFFNLTISQKSEGVNSVNAFVQIDEFIAQKKYDNALNIIEKLETKNRYLDELDYRLNLMLRKAKVWSKLEVNDKAISLLLSGLNEINGNQNLAALKFNYSLSIGELFLEANNFTKSREYFYRSLNESKSVSDTLNILKSYLEIGVTYYREKNNDSATRYYNKILDFPVKDIYKETFSRAYNNLSIIYIEDNELSLAEESANKSLQIKKELGDTLQIAYAMINLASIHYKNKDFGKAEQSYKKTYESLIQLKQKEAEELKEGILYNLAYVNEELRNYKKAYEYLDEATDLTDSLAEISRKQNISEVEAKYNVAREAQIAEEEKSKRQQAQFLFYGTALAFIAILALGYIFYRNYRLKQQNKLENIENQAQTKIINATIDAKEKERKAIAETLHDSVSALLSSANLHLQATKAQLKQKAPQEVTKAQTIVNEASVKIRDLSHELISSVLLKFGLAFAVHDMCQKYSNSELALHSDDDGIKRYHQDFEIKIHNIIEELINNILKHSKANNATVMLAHKENDMLSVRISDDGVGFNPKQVRGKDGLGLSHIEARIKVMKGVFNIISSKDNGTNIFILVPIQFKEKSVSA